MKQLLERFIKAYAKQQQQEITTLITPDTMFESTMIGSAKGIDIIPLLKLPGEPWEISTMTITNYIEEGDHCIATFHHLCAKEEKNIFYPFVYGGKIYLKGSETHLQKVYIDLEYEYGNTYIAKGIWKLYAECKDKRSIPTSLFSLDSYRIKDVVYKFFLALDQMDNNLFKSCITNDIVILRAGVNQDIYELRGIENSEDFLQKDKSYFDQNQYSVHLHEIKELDAHMIKVVAWHLSPGKPGNKQLSIQTKFTQFYNEIIDILIIKEGPVYKIKRAQFNRKETPVLYGYEYIEL